MLLDIVKTSKQSFDLSIIIPVYNEALTVSELLEQVYDFDLGKIKRQLIIVESNSHDGSREIVLEFAKNKPDVTIVLQPRPMGKGTAVRSGLKLATGEIILIQDADLEYSVTDYPKLLQPILDGQTDFVLGSRHLRYQQPQQWAIRNFKGRDKLMAFIMNIGGVLFHGLFNFVYGTKLSDPTTMFKVFRRNLIQKLHLTGKYFEFDFELVSKLIRTGHQPLEVAIHYKSRSPSEGKKVSVSRDVIRWFWVILKYRFLPVEKL